MAKFYITTSIPYVNGPPHIGFALEAIQADVLARWQEQQGNDVFFLTGTDEHGSKIVKAAEDIGITPKEFTDNISHLFQKLIEALNIANTEFIRTSDQEKHWPVAQEVWKRLKEQGDLYKAEYEGLYCIGCEGFITEKELVNGECPIHKKAPEQIKEENYFFRISKYQDRIKKALKEDVLRIVPFSRKNEILQFIDQGLEDISFSRPKEKLQWGVPVPDDETQVMYVWADALSNYISALDYPNGEYFKTYWPADVHAVGKDIVRFHAVIWPAMLFSLGLPLPHTLFVHGFITVDGQKMSKSLGNVIDPFELIEKYGADATRYFFLREVPSTEDGDFSYEKFETRYNADLASGLGNLVARVLTLAAKGNVSLPERIENEELRKELEHAKANTKIALDNFAFNEALEQIWSVIHFCDGYIEQEKPWQDIQGKAPVLADLMFAISQLAILLVPFLPETAQKISEQVQSKKSEPLFPRVA